MHFPLRRSAAVVNMRTSDLGNNDYFILDLSRESTYTPTHLHTLERIDQGRRARPARRPLAEEGLRQVARMPPSKSRQSCESLMKS